MLCSSKRFLRLEELFQKPDEMCSYDGCLDGKEASNSTCCCDFGSVCSMDGVSFANNDSPSSCGQQAAECEEQNCIYSEVDEGVHHAALNFALDYLGFQDLLSVERVCRYLHSAVREDPLLWRNIHIDQPLNEKITDDILLQLTNRAHGNLQCSSLVECPRITDEGLKRELESNPRKIVDTMDLSPFRLDIDELITEYAEGGNTSFADMKKVWIERIFTYIFESAPSNLAFFMQSMYAQSIGHMVSTASLSHRLGGLYCLYCLHETQPFKPPYKIYLSIGELRKLKELVVHAKEKNVNVASAVVKRMLEKNMFLFGSVDMKESSALETVNQLTELQNARIQVAYDKLFADTSIENYVHMDLGMEVSLNAIKKMSTDYSEAKKLALNEASEIVDVQDIKHISEDDSLIGDTIEKIAEDWNVQRGVFYEQIGLDQQLVPVEAHKEQQLPEIHVNENFDKELERMLTDV